MPSVSEFRRSSSDSLIAGVCGGVARTWGIDPAFVRVATAVLALSSGIGLFVYLAVWLLVPRDDKQLSVLKQKWPWARSKADVTLWVIAGVVIVLLVTTFGQNFPFGFWPVVLIGLIWFFGFRGSKRSEGSSPPAALPRAPETEAFEQAAAAWQQRVAEHRRQVNGVDEEPWQPIADTKPVPTTQAMPQPRPDGFQPFATPGPFEPHATAHEVSAPLAPTPAAATTAPAVIAAPTKTVSRKRKRVVWLMALGFCAAAMITLGLLSTLVTVPAVAYPAALLGAVGLALVVGAFFARPRGLIFIAIALGVATLAASLAIPANLGDISTGSVDATYTTVSEIPKDLSLGAGDITMDMSNLTIDRDATIDVDLRVGDVALILPDKGNVNVTWEFSGVGDVNYPKGSDDGTKLTGHYEHNPDDASHGTVQVNVRIGVGDLAVQ